ncbi:hypothetical protein [Allokutzneria oryzae]|uniref:Uncharacterized protein n=1 Tax=Allokutzneria oryzae TaxID=1378989 RepID=A0ABV6A183_9PSEU
MVPPAHRSEYVDPRTAGGGASRQGGLGEPTVYGAVEMVRNGFGLVGMTLISAVFVGAWLPVVAYSAYLYPLAPDWSGASAVDRVLGWPLWPSSTALSVAVAGALWLVGAALTSGRADRSP